MTDKAKAAFTKQRIIVENSDIANDLHDNSCYGSRLQNNDIQISMIEALYLFEKAKLNVYDGRKHILAFDEFVRRATKKDSMFWVRYSVYRDLRNRGYVVKTALKFGADYRVYDRGIKPGEDHAKWIVYPVHESSSMTWYEFAAKNRVAHSTRKRLLIGIVDEEGDCTYYEIKWVRP